VLPEFGRAELQRIPAETADLFEALRAQRGSVRHRMGLMVRVAFDRPVGRWRRARSSGGQVAEGASRHGRRMDACDDCSRLEVSPQVRRCLRRDGAGVTQQKLNERTVSRFGIAGVLSFRFLMGG